jgi:hypothetical protein
MELASHMTRPKQPRFERVNRSAKIAALNPPPPRERNEVFRQKLVLFICYFQAFFFVISELCDVLFMPRRF